MHVKPAFARLRAAASRLRADTSGIALVEFAISLPFFFGLAMYGTEVARMAIIRMQVSQLAITLADNASRLGQTDNSGVAPPINETDIDSVMYGATEQGKAIDLKAKGRIILSSYENDKVSGRPYFHWQRCQGELSAISTYGDQGLKNGTFPTWRINGIGPNNPQLTPPPNMAVMVAEVYYSFEGIFGRTFVSPTVMRQEAAFLVRDDRNLNPSGELGGVKQIAGYTSKSPCPLI